MASDRALGRNLVEQGLAKPEHVEECLRLQDELASRGVQPIPDLRDLLARKGWLTTGLGELDAAAADPANRFGSYVRVRKLGAGGMGEVWLAWNVELRRKAALKFLLHDNPKEIARFQREARTAAALNHPNIAAVYEIGERDGRPYLAMQYIDGVTLDAIPRKDPKLVAELVRDAAVAVHAAHEAGIVHRDLKPRNIMVEGKRVYVMDFGLARSMAPAEASLSMTGDILGTPNYMSPEQSKSEPVDARSDVYSLGATLYHLLAGRPPFSGKDVYDLLRRIVEEEPRPIRLARPEMDRSLETIVLKCLEKRPDRRYASAFELAADLTRWLNGEAVRARPASVTFRTARFLRKRRAVLGVSAAATLLAVGIASAVFVPRWLEERRARMEALRAKEQTEREKAETEVYENAKRELHALRLRSYRSDWRLTSADRDRYLRLIEECSRQMAATGPSADGFWVIGRARHLLGDDQGAKDAYDAGLAVRADHGPCLLYKARLLIDHALEMDPSDLECTETVAEAVELLTRGIGAGRIHPIELDLARGYDLALRKQPHIPYCTEMLEKWKGEDFREEFLLIRGLCNRTRQFLDSSEAIRLRPAYVEAYHRRGLAQIRTDPAGAVRDFTEALRIHPWFAPAYFGRAKAHHQLGEPAKAVEDVTEGLRIRPDVAWAHLIRAHAHLVAGNYKDAIADYTRGLDLAPGTCTPVFGRGLVYQAQGDLEKAFADFERAIEINPKFAKAYNSRGRVRQDRGDPAGATQDYTRAINLDPEYPLAYFNRGIVRRDHLRDWEGAEEDFTNAIRLNERWTDAYVARGEVRHERKDRSGALADFSKAVDLEPARPYLYQKRGKVRRLYGDPEGAMADFNRALELDPKYAAAYVGRGDLRGALGDHAGAVADFTRAIEIEPRNAQAYNARGNSRLSLKDTAGASADFSRAIEIDPAYALAYFNRGFVKSSTGDASGAYDDYTKAIELDPKMAEAWANRAFLRERSGDRAGAITDLEHALRIAPPGWKWRAAFEKQLRKWKS